MLFPPPQVIFGLLLLSIAAVLIWDIRYNPFEDSSRTLPLINVILISYVYVFKRSCNSVMKGSRVESIKEARKEYKNHYRKGVKKTYRFNS